MFNDTEEFVLTMDEQSSEVRLILNFLFHKPIKKPLQSCDLQVVVWDALTAEIVARWPSNHVGSPRWLEHCPTEAAFVTCGTDRSVRFWKENP